MEDQSTAQTRYAKVKTCFWIILQIYNTLKSNIYGPFCGPWDVSRTWLDCVCEVPQLPLHFRIQSKPWSPGNSLYTSVHNNLWGTDQVKSINATSKAVSQCWNQWLWNAIGLEPRGSPGGSKKSLGQRGDRDPERSSSWRDYVLATFHHSGIHGGVARRTPLWVKGVCQYLKDSGSMRKNDSLIWWPFVKNRERCIANIVPMHLYHAT